MTLSRRCQKTSRSPKTSCSCTAASAHLRSRVPWCPWKLWAVNKELLSWTVCVVPEQGRPPGPWFGPNLSLLGPSHLGWKMGPWLRSEAPLGQEGGAWHCCQLQAHALSQALLALLNGPPSLPRRLACLPLVAGRQGTHPRSQPRGIPTSHVGQVQSTVREDSKMVLFHYYPSTFEKIIVQVSA